MESDIEYLMSRLSKIEGFGDTGENLVGIVRSKKLPEKKAEPVAVAKPESNTEPAATKDSSEEPKEKSDADSDKPSEEPKEESK